MPYIAVLICILDTVKNLFYGIILIWAQNHQTLVALVHHDVLADYLPQDALIKEMISKLAEVVNRLVVRQRPVECKLVTAVGIIGEIARVNAVGDYKELDIIEQSAERGLLIALYLIVGLFEFYATLLEFNLHERQTIDEDGDIISAGLTAFYGNLVGYLELILAPMVLVQELYPNTVLTILCLKGIKVAEFLGFLEEGSAFQINANLVKLLVGKGSSANIRKGFGVMFFKLRLEIAEQIGLFLNLDIVITHVL